MLPKRNTFRTHLSLIFLFLILAFNLFSCQDRNTLEVRLKEFYGFLDPNLISRFEEGDLEPIASSLKNKIKSDPDYKSEFEALKKREAINLFNTQEVVNYYYRSFYRQIEAKKAKK